MFALFQSTSSSFALFGSNPFCFQTRCFCMLTGRFLLRSLFMERCCFFHSAGLYSPSMAEGSNDVRVGRRKDHNHVCIGRRSKRGHVFFDGKQQLFVFSAVMDHIKGRCISRRNWDFHLLHILVKVITQESDERYLVFKSKGSGPVSLAIVLRKT